MEYFNEPVVAVFLRDVTKEVTNFVLSQTIEKNTATIKENKAKLKTMRYSNENVAHEMRTPLSSIIIIINLLLALGFTPREFKRAKKYHLQIRSQAQLLLHFVNDLLDYKLFKKSKFELTLERFDPKAAVESMLDIFKIQAGSQGIQLLF